MNVSQMQPISNKELDYISDCISNEDLLVKQCAAAAVVCHNPTISQALSEHIRTHEQHLTKLTDALLQHQHLAPTQAH
ncbi:hypothetical protein J2T12_000570 [Paenibacillus anaericanus]|uniref:hypothetical protein n=1 Tax=Paenibacillus anaericanus TaxID=170367 RepID=UPI00278A6299|nr:hypothetical protein [Paenibacillus anaericanus]MDQ0087176.1 hypothetical protein [Paenibacillus anaericanus]